MTTNQKIIKKQDRIATISQKVLTLLTYAATLILHGLPVNSIVRNSTNR